MGRAGGVRSGDDVVAARRLEDLAALEVLGSDHRWLEFADHQYLAPAEPPDPRRGGARARRRHRRARPHGGLRPHGPGQPGPRHGPRGLAAGAGRAAGPRWFCYEDHGYKHIPGLLGLAGGQAAAGPSPGPRRPSSRTSPTRSASAGPSAATPARSPRSSTTTRSRPGWRATSPSSSGAWPRRRRAGKAWPTTSEPESGRETTRPRGARAGRPLASVTAEVPPSPASAASRGPIVSWPDPRRKGPRPEFTRRQSRRNGGEIHRPPGVASRHDGLRATSGISTSSSMSSGARSRSTSMSDRIPGWRRLTK